VSRAQQRLSQVRALIDAEPAEPAADGATMPMLRQLCRAAVRSLPATGVGVSVMTEAGVQEIAAASDDTTQRIEELQFSLGEGPCMDAFTSRRPVLLSDLRDGGASRWPAYCVAADGEGVRGVFAFPVQNGAARLGVLDVYRDRPEDLSLEGLARALTFADVAMTMLVDGQAGAPAGRLAGGMDKNFENRAELHQAQGMVMVQMGITLSEALALMRAYAYANDLDLNVLAADIVARRVRLDQGEGA